MESLNTITLLRKLVALPSVFPNENTLSKYLEKKLRSLGFTTKIVKTVSRRNIVATFGMAKKYLGFYGHMDTVPPHPEYTFDPYSVQIHNDVARGLGVADMKGGIAAIITAAEYAVAHKIPVKIILGVDEENISQGAHDIINSRLVDDLSLLIVAESGQIKDATQDVSASFGRKGRILFTAHVQGKTAHAAESHKAVNAVSQAAQFINSLEKLNFTTHHNLGGTEIIVHSISGSTDSFSIPNHCEITFSALTTPPTNSQLILEKIATVTQELPASITIETATRVTPYSESYECDRTNPLVKKLEQEVLSKFRIQPTYAQSVADENVFANRLQIPVITIGPIGGGDHTAQEWVSLTSLEKTTQLYTQVLKLYRKV